MPTPITKIAIIDTSASPDDVVTLSGMQEGGEGATRQVFEIEDEEASVEDNQMYAPSGVYRIDMAGLEGSAAERTLLDSWIDGRELEFAGFGTSLIMQGRAMLEFRPGYENHKTWRIMAQKAAYHGYFTGTTGRACSELIYSENGLAEYLWGDATGSGVADGWSKTGTGTATFSGGLQTLEADENTLGIDRTIYFPFAGETLTFSINVDSYTNASNLTRKLIIETIDVNGSVLTTDSATFTGTGRKSHSYELDSGTHQVRLEVEITETGTGSADMSFGDPMLSINGNTTYYER